MKLLWLFTLLFIISLVESTSTNEEYKVTLESLEKSIQTADQYTTMRSDLEGINKKCIEKCTKKAHKIILLLLPASFLEKCIKKCQIKEMKKLQDSYAPKSAV
ncbi:Defensin-like protein [Trichinella spiralis]|uniref:Defensin-like protein n=1 Tax=Trichinella spiralis TaxID=6334 RepID=A0ABR3K326_TRISP